MSMKYLFFTALILLFSACNQKVAVVAVHDNETLMNENGDLVTKAQYEKLFRYENGYYKSYNNGKYGIISTSGKTIVPPIYDNIKQPFNGAIIVQQEGRFGLMNDAFKETIKPQYKVLKPINTNLFLVKHHKFGCVDANDNIELDLKYDMVYPFFEGLARVQINEKFGFINNDCEEVAKPVYDFASDFYNGYAQVKRQGKMSFINNNAQELSSLQYEDAQIFKGKN